MTKSKEQGAFDKIVECIADIERQRKFLGIEAKTLKPEVTAADPFAAIKARLKEVKRKRELYDLEIRRTKPKELEKHRENIVGLTRQWNVRLRTQPNQKGWRGVPLQRDMPPGLILRIEAELQQDYRDLDWSLINMSRVFDLCMMVANARMDAGLTKGIAEVDPKVSQSDPRKVIEARIAELEEDLMRLRSLQRGKRAA